MSELPPSTPLRSVQGGAPCEQINGTVMQAPSYRSFLSGVPA